MYNNGALTMKTSAVALLVAFLIGAGTPMERAAAQVSPIVTFEDHQVGTFPEGFQSGMTGQWKATKWSVQDFQHTRVLAHLGFWGEDPDGVFPVCWVKGSKAKDLTLTVRLFPVRPPADVRGAVHDGAGIVVRFKDPDNYYLMRAVPHEMRVRIYKVANGKRATIGGKEVDIALERWHELKLQVSGNTFTPFLNGEKLFHVMDSTFEEAGSYGLWSKPNNVTYFDDLKAEVVK
jgi:hypothetical protein